jgi:hypothetical protein
MIKKKETTITKQVKRTIPHFKNRQELAEFWDTHDAGDYWDELKPVELVFAKNLSENLNIRFDDETLVKIRKEAKKRGVGPTTLVRMWTLEKLQQ